MNSFYSEHKYALFQGNFELLFYFLGDINYSELNCKCLNFHVLKF